MEPEPRHFLLYWRPATADEVLAGGLPCRYAASNQFGRLEKEDIVWAVTCREGSLRLVARRGGRGRRAHGRTAAAGDGRSLESGAVRAGGIGDGGGRARR